MCRALDTAYPGPGQRRGAVFIRAQPKIENRTDNCPDSHPIYNQMANLCTIDQSRNMGPSICSLGTNPIHGFTGNKYQIEDIYSSRNSQGLEFKWFYNSMVGENQGNWRHSYQVSIESNLAKMVNETASYADNLPTNVTASVMTEDGNVYKYRNAISWSTRTTMTEIWQDDSNNGGRRLETVTDQSGRAVGFKFYARGNRIEEFSLNGRLQKITSDSKNQVQLAWVNDRVDSVTDELGNTIQFHYDDESELLMDIIVDGGVYYRFSYHDKLLASIAYPDGTPQIATDNPTKEYKYEDPRFTGYLTSVIDENGNTSASWSYDDQGRAISSSHANDSDKHTLSYGADGSTTITDSLGNSRKYTFVNIDSLIRIESSTGGECEQCGASAKEYKYDSNGFLLSKIDRKGTKTVYTRNDLGQELSRTEAFGFPEERIVTTEWHPLFHAPVRITDGGRITEFSYDEDGRLIKKTKRAAE
jgi:YD repeat-containing protein